jgi:hypothetical protein
MLSSPLNLKNRIITIKKAASAKNEKNTSLLAPNPSKDDPVSIAEITVKNLPKLIKYNTKIMSPLNEKTGCNPEKGINNKEVTVVDSVITYPILNIYVVLELRTEDLFKSLKRV